MPMLGGLGISRSAVIARGVVAAGAGTEVVIMAVMAGQSNMAGRNNDDGLYVQRDNKFQFGGTSGEPTTYRQLTNDCQIIYHNETSGLNRVGADDQLLDDLAVANPNAIVVAVPCATGSSALFGGVWASSATPGGGGGLFENMVTQANLARDAILTEWPGATIEVRRYWVQGEQDASNSVSTSDYLAALEDFDTHSQSRITGATGSPFILGSLLPQKWITGQALYNAAYAAINEAHVDASLTIPGCRYIRGPDDRTDNDNLHYMPATVARAFGARMALALTDTVGPTMTSVASYTNGSASTLAIPLSASDPFDHATFHVNGGADAANFEISDPYLTPTLRWTGDGTGPANGVYEVGVRARDGMGNYGPTQTMTVTVSAEVSPASFFTSGEPGIVWDVSPDGGGIFQDMAGTIPVTAVGQPVGKILDLSPNGNHWTALADNNSRPTLQVDSDGMYCVRGDGVNDILVAALPFVDPSNPKFTATIGIKASPQAGARTLLACHSTVATQPFVIPFQSNGTTSELRMQARNNTNSTLPTSAGVSDALDGTKKVLTAQFFGSNQTSRMRDAADRPAGGGPGGYTTANLGTWSEAVAVTRASIFGDAPATPRNFFGGDLYSGYVINRLLSDNDIKAGEDWAAARQLTSALP